MDGARPMNGAHQSHRSAKFKIQQRLHHIKYKAVAYSNLLKEQSICKNMEGIAMLLAQCS
jgi:hypothetical protein